MTSLERIRCAARLGEPDIVPVAPYLGNHGAHVSGMPLDEYCRSGRLMADAQWRAWQLYQQDAIVPQSDNYYIAEGFGTRVEFRPDCTPVFRSPAVTELRDIAQLSVPDPQQHGRMPVYLDAIHRLAEKNQGNAAIRAPGTGPFSLASHLLGTERFLLELALAERRPGGPEDEALRQLLALTTQALIAFAKACVDAGAHLVQAGDSLASPDMISPKTYRQWALPAERQFFAELNAYAQPRGALTLLHICGNTTPILEDMASTGAQILELDAKVDLAAAKAKVGSRVCLMGNLDPVGVLWQGTAAEVEQAARRAIAAAGPGGGFILGSGCEVPPAAPRANLKAMILTAWMTKYPLDAPTV